MVRNPTNELENDRETCWIIGGIQRRHQNDAEEHEQYFFIQMIPDRRGETFAEVFRNNILPNTTIHTDSHRSYPAAINVCNQRYQMNFRHETVNHSVEYVSETGIHTNTIKNIWSHLRSYWRGRHSVVRDQLSSSLVQFIYFKHFKKEAGRDAVFNSL